MPPTLPRVANRAPWGPLRSTHPACSSRRPHQHPSAPLHLHGCSCTLTLNRAQCSSTGRNTWEFGCWGSSAASCKMGAAHSPLWEAEGAGAGLNVITQIGCQLCSPSCPISCGQLTDVGEPRGHGCCWEEIQTSSTQLGFACKLARQPPCGGGSAEPRACVSVWHLLTHEGTLLPVRSHRETSGECPEPPLGLLMCCWGAQRNHHVAM